MICSILKLDHTVRSKDYVMSDRRRGYDLGDDDSLSITFTGVTGSE